MGPLCEGRLVTRSPPALTDGKNCERVMRAVASACNTRAATILMSQLFVSASVIYAVSCGSLNVSHQPRSAKELAPEGALVSVAARRKASGESTTGRL